VKKSGFLIIILVMVFISSPMVRGDAEPVVNTMFFHTDIREALDEISLQTGVNIIYDDSVRGTVSLDLEDVPLEEALRRVLIGQGISFRKIDDFYLVGMPDPRSPAFQEIAESETFRVEYISVNDALDLLPAFYDQFLQASTTLERITITATPEIIESFQEDLERIDQREPQVKLQMVVTEVSKEAMQELGADFLNFSFDIEETIEDPWEMFLGMARGIVTLETDVFGQFLTELKLLERDKKAEIAADPWVIVSNRETASLFVGEEQVLILEPEEAAARVERIDVGVELEITPRVVNNEEVQVIFSPKISHFSEEGDRGFKVRRSELDTTVYAKTGQTLMLAGITVESHQDSGSGVPILRRIPILRWLFGQTREVVEERELLIFITPEIW